MVLAISKPTERDRICACGFGAVSAGIEPPFVVGVTGAVGPAGDRDAAAGTHDTHTQVCGSKIVCADRFAGDGSAQRDDAAFVASVRAGAMRRRSRQETEPVAQYLRLVPGSEESFR